MGILVLAKKQNYHIPKNHVECILQTLQMPPILQIMIWSFNRLHFFSLFLFSFFGYNSLIYALPILSCIKPMLLPTFPAKLWLHLSPFKTWHGGDVNKIYT